MKGRVGGPALAAPELPGSNALIAYQGLLQKQGPALRLALARRWYPASEPAPAASRHLALALVSLSDFGCKVCVQLLWYYQRRYPCALPGPTESELPLAAPVSPGDRMHRVFPRRV